jgi:hypothetical protein
MMTSEVRFGGALALRLVGWVRFYFLSFFLIPSQTASLGS